MITQYSQRVLTFLSATLSRRQGLTTSKDLFQGSHALPSWLRSPKIFNGRSASNSPPPNFGFRLPTPQRSKTHCSGSHVPQAAVCQSPRGGHEFVEVMVVLREGAEVVAPEALRERAEPDGWRTERCARVEQLRGAGQRQPTRDTTRRSSTTLHEYYIILHDLL